MVEPSIWFSVHEWFTPTTLFVVLNLVIATIAITSKALRAGDDHPAAEPRKLGRAPSLVLDRIRSFNLNLYRSPAPLVPTDPIRPSPSPSPSSPPDPVADLASEVSDHEQLHFTRSQSDAHPTAGEMPEKLAPKMKKSASVQSAFSHFEEKEIAPPPQPEEYTAAPVDNGDGEEEGAEVDARADDFINRFRHQLKLQRLDSLLRYKEMINRGR